jgi:hypothetical protein
VTEELRTCGDPITSSKYVKTIFQRAQKCPCLSTYDRGSRNPALISERSTGSITPSSR